MKKLYKILAKFPLRFHNFSYRITTKFAIKAEGGLYPKHRIMNYHQFFVDNISPEDAILNIGCENGALTYDVAKKEKKIVGIDLNKENIKIAKEKYSAPNIRYLVGDIIKNLPNQKFDTIILSNILEHIENRIE